MLTIHFLRHGDTAASADGVLCGDLDLPLAESGKAQATRIVSLTATLGIGAIHASPKLRARMTAEPTARHYGITPLVEDGLREISYGSWEGEREEAVAKNAPEAYAAWNADPALYGPPGGENGFAIAARALPIVARIRDSHAADGGQANRAVLVVSHKATIRVITCALLGVPISRFRDRVGCPTASMTTFEFHARGPLLVRLGQVVP